MNSPSILPVSAVQTVDDGLPWDLRPSDLFRVGIDESALRAYTVKLFDDAANLLASEYRQYPNVLDSEVWTMKKLADRLDRGWGWHIERLIDVQPRSHRILSELDTRLCVGLHAIHDPDPPVGGYRAMLRAFLIVRGRVYQLRWYHTASPEETGIPDFEGGALPDALVQSWWFRFAGLQIVRELPGPVNDFASPMLGYPACGTGIDRLLAALGPAARRRFMPALTERFGKEALTKTYNAGRPAVVCFLDTRVPLSSSRLEGDQFLVRMDRSDQLVYHARECRFDELRVLDPSTLAECFDRYFEHVLARCPGEFDFLPYGRPI